MRKTETCRQHHQELRTIAARIEILLDAEAIAAVVCELFGKFKERVGREESQLYDRIDAA